MTTRGGIGPVEVLIGTVIHTGVTANPSDKSRARRGTLSPATLSARQGDSITLTALGNPVAGIDIGARATGKCARCDRGRVLLWLLLAFRHARLAASGSQLAKSGYRQY